MREFKKYIVVCNKITKVKIKENESLIELESRDDYKDKNIIIELTKFVTNTYKLNERYKDLIEIASFVYTADRKASRGTETVVEAHSWSRIFEIHIGVRDLKFWNSSEIKEKLNELLKFITGDHHYEFCFYKTGNEIPFTLFDNEDYKVETKRPNKVLLFSGGLDSLAGTIETLATTDRDVCLVSHQTGHPATRTTQKRLFEEFKKEYGDRVNHYIFNCSLTKEQSKDESQRTRSFLYTSIAFAVAVTNGINNINVYENGITSLNFPETQDQMNARASRTTHPKTLDLLQRIFTDVLGKKFYIKNEYMYKTKTDVVDVIKTHNKQNLIDTSVSCSVTRKKKKGYTHCGKCSQCIDRIFAIHAADLVEYDDNGIYDFRFYKEDLDEPIITKSLTDYLRLAQEFKFNSFMGFYAKFGNEIIDFEPYVMGKDEKTRIERIRQLGIRHADQIDNAVKNMIARYTSSFAPKRPNSFYVKILDERLYQKHRRDIQKETNTETYTEDIEEIVKLRKFRKGELQSKLKEFIKELRLEKYETVPSSKISLIARRLRKEGYDAKEASIGTVLRKMDYAYVREDNR
ncbi:MAG: 7-cyano-7-deazaguanine synthase [Melioribacteraceae bacterium]|nr:7-cyano-7-deazaguanine synthase [Melioribacteraceae bacterium]